jgi:hypothetical protein
MESSDGELWRIPPSGKSTKASLQAGLGGDGECGEGLGSHGKEGVAGSSPAEGFCFKPFPASLFVRSLSQRPYSRRQAGTHPAPGRHGT